MYFFWLLIVMSFLESDDDFSLVGLMQESWEVDITSFTSDEEDHDRRSNFQMLLDAAKELGGNNNSKYDDRDFESVLQDNGLGSQMEHRRMSDLPVGNSPKRMRTSDPSVESDVDVS